MHTLTLAQQVRAIASGEISSSELVRHYLQRIDALDHKFNSFITIDADRALQRARELDNDRERTGLLHGIPIAHKDIFCTDGVRTTCASRMLDTFVAPYDATVVTRLNDAGVIMLGKTNMDEFAMGSSSENSYYGAVKNPWDTDRIPGGSSGGSAVVVAARMAPACTGTDTGGSIRQPASMCGITGLKPTYGRVSRYGMIAYASSLDQGGPMAQTAEDCAYLLQCMAGFDERDSTSIERAVPDYLAQLGSSLAGQRIGLPKEFFAQGLDADVQSVIEDCVNTLRDAGCKIQEISLPNMHLAVAAYYVIAPAEASSNLSRYDGVRYGHRCEQPQDLLDLYMRSRAEGFGKEVKRRIMIGTYALSAGYYDAYYLRAQKIRRLISQDYERAFDKVDVILGPTAPSTAFKLNEKMDDPVMMYLSDIYTIGVNLAGLPAITMPAGFSDGLPVGVQMIGNYFEESRLLNIAHQYQQHTDWHQYMPAGCE